MAGNYGSAFVPNIGILEPNPHIIDTSANALHLRDTVKVVIIEQPASKSLRWRYESEGRTAGSLCGVTSTSSNKTYPTIEVVGWQGKAQVVVSCVTVNDFKAHPHKLVGRDCCDRGVCTKKIDIGTMTASFNNLGVHCVKKKDIKDSLRLRNSIKVDPFLNGFEHRKNTSDIDLNVFRLSFQVVLKNPLTGSYNIPLKPVVSDPIMDKKPDGLNIHCLSDCTSHVSGGRKIILLCEKVDKNDIQVRFYEIVNDELVWESFGEFKPRDVYKQMAIPFKTPKYRTMEILTPVRVLIQLRKASTGEVGNSIPFEFTPSPNYLQKCFENELLQIEQNINFPCIFKEEPEPGPSYFIPVNIEPKYDNLNAKPTILDLDTKKLKVWSSEEMQRIDNQVVVVPVLSFDEEMLSMTQSLQNIDMSFDREDKTSL